MRELEARVIELEGDVAATTKDYLLVRHQGEAPRVPLAALSWVLPCPLCPACRARYMRLTVTWCIG